MSDQSQGEGWWQASDGKWYAPQPPSAPGGPPATGPAAPASPPPGAVPPPAGGGFPPPAGAGYPPPAGGPTPPPSTQPFGPPPGAAPPGAMPPPGAPPIGAPGTPPGPPAKSGLGRGPIIGIVVAAVVIVAALAFFLTRDDGNKQNVSADKSDQSDKSDSSSSSKQSSSKSSKSSSSSAKGNLPAGFKEISDATEGVSIGVPSDFKEINPSAFAGNSGDSDFSNLNPDLAPLVSGGNSFLTDSVLAAAGSANNTPSFIVVAKIQQGFDPTDPQIASEIQSELQSAGASDVTTTNVNLPAGPALRLGVTLQINTASGTGSVHETLFFVTVGPTTWAIVGASVGDNANSALFDQSAQTFAVTS